MLKLKVMFVVVAMLVGFSAKAQIFPLASAILNPSEMEKPALCETGRLVTSDIYLDDPYAPTPFVTGLVDQRPQESGILLLSSMDYAYSVNLDMSGYGSYISIACINYAQQKADGACAIDRKWNPNMNQFVTSRPQSAQVTARLFSFRGVYDTTTVNQRGFEQASATGNEPPFFNQLNYQVTCDGNGSVTGIVVDKLQ